MQLIPTEYRLHGADALRILPHPDLSGRWCCKQHECYMRADGMFVSASSARHSQQTAFCSPEAAAESWRQHHGSERGEQL